MKKYQVLRSIFTRAKVCGWVLGAVAFPSRDPSAGVTDPSASSERNWSEVLAKVEVQVETWFRRLLSLKGRGRRAPCTFSLSSFTGCPYFPCLGVTGWL